MRAKLVGKPTFRHALKPASIKHSNCTNARSARNPCEQCSVGPDLLIADARCRDPSCTEPIANVVTRNAEPDCGHAADFAPLPRTAGTMARYGNVLVASQKMQACVLTQNQESWGSGQARGSAKSLAHSSLL